MVESDREMHMQVEVTKLLVILGKNSLVSRKIILSHFLLGTKYQCFSSVASVTKGKNSISIVFVESFKFN